MAPAQPHSSRTELALLSLSSPTGPALASCCYCHEARLEEQCQLHTTAMGLGWSHASCFGLKQELSFLVLWSKGIKRNECEKN
ncbi:hypothetical protein Y1Q_0004091 [Alligator mississippiensis]|uniref:Uncharacterized protein n=1 Tax=Alligator mississippiensis TaxID=8496 RepID=A0A151PHX6_ALLMI|nr:hypothetical protein Y1Q_0004091 [Alligator mississippiensis]